MWIFGIIFEIFGELILQWFLEGIAEAWFHFSKKGEKQVDANHAGFGCLVLGAVLGGLSLLIFRESFITTEAMRVVNLIITPIILGGIMTFTGKMRLKRGKEIVRIERFFFAYLFALGVAAVRYLFTQ